MVYFMSCYKKIFVKGACVMKRYAIIMVVLLVAALGLPAEARSKKEVSNEDITKAIDAGIQYLRTKQKDNGSWGATGPTALAVMALKYTGAKDNDPVIKKAVAFLLKQPCKRTYESALLAITLQMMNSKGGKREYKEKIEEARNYLVAAQLESGMWTYTNPNGDAQRDIKQGNAKRNLKKTKEIKTEKPKEQMGDNSNTQFAILGLRSVLLAGMEVPTETLERAHNHYISTQSSDGSWGYRGKGKGYGSMTCAGFASIYITNSELGAKKSGKGGSIPPEAQKTLEWIGKNFSVTENPGRGGTWHYYYLYSMERAGIITGVKKFGDYDWHLEGSRHLVFGQADDGSWRETASKHPGNEVINTSFALLFLGKGKVPVMLKGFDYDDGSDEFEEAEDDAPKK